MFAVNQGGTTSRNRAPVPDVGFNVIRTGVLFGGEEVKSGDE